MKVGVTAAGCGVVLGAAAPEIDCCYDAHRWFVMVGWRARATRDRGWHEIGWLR
jgi:hypothetical protein